jgi:ribose transport system ATP-binding protein
MQIYGKIKKRLFWIDEKLRKSITEQYIGKFGIKTQGSEQIVRYLSGGNQQKVVVAKCLATNSEILLLDDPTFGVDIQAKHEIMKIIDDYAKEGNSVIMVSSEFNEIADFCDSIYIMRRGTITKISCFIWFNK